MELVRDRILKTVQARHASYFKAYLSEKGLTTPGQMFDPIDLVLYVSTRLQSDNDWLVDKLAQLESVRSSQQAIIDEQYKKEKSPRISDQNFEESVLLLEKFEG